MAKSRQPMFGIFSRKQPKYCPNCGQHYSKCPCWQEYVEGQLPMSNQGDDMYLDVPTYGPLLITPDEVKRAETPAKKTRVFGNRTT